jgi:hypothetical protein
LARGRNLHVLEDGLNINIDLRADRIDLEGACDVGAPSDILGLRIPAKVGTRSTMAT